MELHAIDLPTPTPEGRLVRRAREMASPKLSIRAAAGRIGLSAEQWGTIERGYRPTRAGEPPQPFSPPAATLARMAHALGISPERLKAEGQRPDAAEMLRAAFPPEESVPAVALVEQAKHLRDALDAFIAEAAGLQL